LCCNDSIAPKRTFQRFPGAYIVTNANLSPSPISVCNSIANYVDGARLSTLPGCNLLLRKTTAHHNCVSQLLSSVAPAVCPHSAAAAGLRRVPENVRFWLKQARRAGVWQGFGTHPLPGSGPWSKLALLHDEPLLEADGEAGAVHLAGHCDSTNTRRVHSPQKKNPKKRDSFFNSRERRRKSSAIRNNDSLRGQWQSSVQRLGDQADL